jgi:hypothetical protein
LSASLPAAISLSHNNLIKLRKHTPSQVNSN